MTPERRSPLVITGSVQQPELASYQPGHCPECQKPMAVTQCDGIPSYVCIDHRICLPVEDKS